MKRTALLISIIGILIGAESALAQYSSGGGGHRHGSAPTPESGPTPDTRTAGIKGFERAVALQATPDQIAQFQRLSTSTQIARKRAQDLLRLSAKGNKLNWINSTYPLTNDLEEAQGDNEKFLASFSKEQEAGLKKLAKKLRKSDSELTNHSKALSHDLDRDSDDSGVIAVLQKLDKTLGDFQSQQLAIAAEMGIQAPGQSRSQ